jgi:hypothetical protein
MRVKYGTPIRDFLIVKPGDLDIRSAFAKLRRRIKKSG